MEIRILTALDALEYWRIRQEALRGDPWAFSASPDDPESVNLEDVKKRLGTGRDDFFIVGAYLEGRLSGTADFYREKGLKLRHKARVWGVFVAPEKRGLGLGRRMMETLLEHGARVDGVEQILLSVTTTQTAAASLYRSLGFESFGFEPRALKIGDRYVDEEYMVLHVKTVDRG